MIITTTQLGKSILDYARLELKAQCYEKTNNNDGRCIESVVKNFDSNIAPKWKKKLAKYQGSGKSQLAYCAMFVVQVLDKAFAYHKFNYTASDGTVFTNPLRRYGDNLAHTKGLLTAAQRWPEHIRIDKIPAPGSIFMIPTSGDGTTSGYHVGLVWYYDADRNIIGTIEGNTSPGYFLTDDDYCLKRAPKNGIVTKERPAGKPQYYMHVEEFFGTERMEEFKLQHSGLNGLGNSGDDYESGDFCSMDVEIDEGTEESPDSDARIASDNSGVTTDWGKVALYAATAGIVLWIVSRD